MTRRLSTIALLLAVMPLLTLWPHKAFANCTSPAGVESQTIYDFTGHVLKYCDNTSWLTFAAGTVAATQWSNGASSAIYYNGGNVGIGTASPAEKLTVNQGADNVWGFSLYNGANGRLTLGTDASANVRMYSQNAVDLRMGVGADHLTIKSSGNVGIGTTSPGTKLTVDGGASAGGATLIRVTAATTGLDVGLEIAPTATGAHTWRLQAADPTRGTFNDKFNIVDQTAGAARFVIDTSGNVGIGTTSPAQALDIVREGSQANTSFTSYGAANGSALLLAQANGTAASPTVTQSANALGTIAFRGYDGATLATSARVQALAAENWTGSGHGTYLAFHTTPAGSTAVAEKMRIDPSGNVGIGTTNPTGELHVASDGGGELVLERTNASYLSKWSIVSAQNYAGDLTFVDRIASAVRMTLLSSGNVGIGTTAPGNRLTVGAQSASSNANISARGGNANAFEWGHGNTAGYGNTLGYDLGSGVAFLCFSCEAGTTNNTYRTRGLAGTIIKGTNDGGVVVGKIATANADNQSTTEFLRITSAGNVGIGTASPAEKLEVNGTVFASVLKTTSLAPAPAGQTVCYTVSTGNVMGYCSSDMRLKKDIKPLDIVGINTIKALQPVQFKWKKGNDGNALMAGFIAQNVQKAIPEAVYNVKGSEYLGFDSTAILSYAVKAIQEQQSQIDALKAENVDFKAQIDVLRADVETLKATIH